MSTRQQLKERVCIAIDAHRDELYALGEDIRVHPELGYKETRTAALVSQAFARLGIPYQDSLAITGVKGTLQGRNSAATVAYLGELDSVLVRDHPDANPDTGAAHACGHNAQIANLVGVAFGLSESGIMSSLDGNVALMAVPSEEYVEIAYRAGLKKAEKIEFLGGKPELVRLGAFDDIDITMMTHQAVRAEGGSLSIGGPSNGFVAKQITYHGVAAHAGGSPHRGVNALKAALLGLQAIDANRETFQDRDHVRVHPIITKGGDLVNVIPDEVCIETYIRGANVDAIMDAAARVDRCIKAGAMALGASVTIRTLPGFMPRRPCAALNGIYRGNAFELVGEANWWEPSFGAGSTDMGDISQIMPAMEAQARGASGTGHGADYAISDPETAYILPAKAAAMTIIDLLADGAQGAREVIGGYDAPLTNDEYLELLRSQDQLELWKAE